MCRIKKIRDCYFRRAGVTLIELLITISLVAIIGVTILSALSAGVKALAKAQSYYGPQTDILLSLEKIERDLRSSFAWKGIGFQGSSTQVSFAGLVNVSKEDLSDELVLGKISYFINPAGDKLLRNEVSYPQSLSGYGAKEESLAAVEGISFNYYYLDSESQKLAWKSTWDGESMPLGIKVVISFKDVDKNTEITRTIFLHS